ncbi:hypothetical protein Fmac_017601 [Flemingia macrophylla]|uniref:Receptor-like protein 12 n=1 Tax=Flemingia macrophylla TaxID=520843 RepID=A0ABD1M4E8_9FABA
MSWRCSGNFGAEPQNLGIRCPATSTFPKLHIIDLSLNHFSGSLPAKTIQKWKSMESSNDSQLHYEDSNKVWVGRTMNDAYSFTIYYKRMVMVYDNLQKFYNLIAIDLSSNKFNGEIPDVMGDLTRLVLLNLSNNLLRGSIPSSLRKLSNLEASDLSLNHLSGRIPLQLVELTFMSYFNVSFNNLSGPIPQSKQFGTFESSFFEGNQGLCGNQLFKKCKDIAGLPFAPHSASGDDEDSGFLSAFDWKIVLIGYGGGLLVGMATGSTFDHETIAWFKRVCW